jgi:hypothetical protein
MEMFDIGVSSIDENPTPKGNFSELIITEEMTIGSKDNTRNIHATRLLFDIATSDQEVSTEEIETIPRTYHIISSIVFTDGKPIRMKEDII